MNARNVLHNDEVCSNLEIEYITPTGHLEGCYCKKYSKYLPNEMSAMMYCCMYGISDNCWFEIAGK